MTNQSELIRVLCPCCGKRMFDAKPCIEGYISIKCDRCKRVATLTFKGEKTVMFKLPSNGTE